MFRSQLTTLIFLLFSFIACFLAGTMTIACDKEGNPGEPDTKAYLKNTKFSEGDMNIFFTLSLKKAADVEVRVSFQTRDGNAFNGSDYLSLSGDVIFKPGEIKKDVLLSVINDTLREADEYFEIILTGISAGTFEQFAGKITILNDDKWVDFPSLGYSTPVSYEGYMLAWSDEFDAPVISNANWTFETGDGCPNVCGWGNNELEWYTDREQNAFVTDGKLVIEARRESIGGKDYSSARIKSQGKKSFQYGRIDVRALLPVGQGIWPAIWMLGENISTASWPACGEIDIMEYLGHEPNGVHGTGHWGENIAAHKYQGNSIISTGPDFHSAWHVFSIVWKEDEITWLMDDTTYFTLTPSITGPNHPFNDPFFFILNVAVGGNWPGNPAGTTVFPQRMAIDYVRVFQEQ